jgi:hypothetical protein
VPNDLRGGAKILRGDAKRSQGRCQTISGEVQKFSGEMQNDLRGGAKRSQGWCAPPLKIRPCLIVMLEIANQRFIVNKAHTRMRLDES